jgi:hypothetical protein
MKIAKFGLTAVVAVALAVMTVGLLRQARADVLVNTDIPVAPFIANPCNGETIALSGVGHLIIAETVASSGNFLLRLHINGQDISGVGLTTGAKYSLSSTVNQEMTVAAGSEETILETERVIGQGQVPNFDLKFLLHITVNANGDITAFVDNGTAVCH